MVRAANSRGYILWYGNNGNQVTLWRMDNANGWSQIGASASNLTVTAATDVWRLEAKGSTLSGYQNGNLVVQATDSTYAGGSPGIWMYYGANQIDDWSAGNLSSAPPPSYSVGGTVAGLSGTVVLKNTDGSTVSVPANGAFNFTVADGAQYSITVSQQPATQTCTVQNGSGVVAGANVTNISVTCVTTSYSVGGTVSGLVGTVVLKNTNGSTVSLSANGVFNFTVANGAQYTITVSQQPATQTCTVQNGNGVVAGANVTNISVTCVTTSSYSVGGTVSGLAGTVVLQNTDGSTVSVAANGAFNFTVLNGAQYSITVSHQPTNQTCTVQNGSGTVAGANVTNIAVTCVASTGLTVSDNFTRADGGLGTNWTTMAGTLAPQIAGNLVVVPSAEQGALHSAFWSANTFSNDQFVQARFPNSSPNTYFGPGLLVRAANSRGYLLWYGNNDNQVTIWRMDDANDWSEIGASANNLTITPATDVWRLEARGSTLSGYQNGNLVVQTTDTTYANGSPGVWMYYGPNQIDDWSAGNLLATYSVGGTVSGLVGTVMLQNVDGSTVSVAANGAFNFNVLTGTQYSITVSRQPTTQTCTVQNGNGTAAGNVTNIAVTCVTHYAVGGTVSGLLGTLVLKNTDGSAVSLSANGTFNFTVLNGAQYSITVSQQPATQTCTVQNGSGVVAGANVTNISVTCVTGDNFARADGGLGANWAAMTDAPMTISSQTVVGTGGGYSGEIWTGSAFSGNQYSQITITAALSGNQWVGPSVRAQNGGQDLYTGVYWANGGSPMLGIYKRAGGSWAMLTQLATAPLAVGSTLKLEAVGSTLALLVNGTERVTAYDPVTLTGGAPGIVDNGNAAADNWSGGTQGFEAHYLSTDANGVDTYDMISANNGYGPHTLRVLRPTNPAAGVAHNFVYTLPVEVQGGTTYGDGLDTLRALNAANQYNLTIIEPSFGAPPWYANNPTDSNLQYETFMASDLQPWVKANLATTAIEQHWLLGFSKSGLGAIDLLLKHPDLFTLAAAWDFPADMSTYNAYDAAQNYGSDANFQANYRLSGTFVDAYKTPFLTQNRIWIDGYADFRVDVEDFDTLLTSHGMLHTTAPEVQRTHLWSSGWVPSALAGLQQESAGVH
jgi:hypothetical protein